MDPTRSGARRPKPSLRRASPVFTKSIRPFSCSRRCTFLYQMVLLYQTAPDLSSPAPQSPRLSSTARVTAITAGKSTPATGQTIHAAAELTKKLQMR